MQGWRRHAIFKQKPYNLTTNMLKAYLSAQASCLSGFVISNTHPKSTRKTAKRKSVRQRKCHFSCSSSFSLGSWGSLSCVTSQFVMFISCALRAQIEDGIGSRLDSWHEVTFTYSLLQFQGCDFILIVTHQRLHTQVTPPAVQEDTHKEFTPFFQTNSVNRHK